MSRRRLMLLAAGLAASTSAVVTGEGTRPGDLAQRATFGARVGAEPYPQDGVPAEKPHFDLENRIGRPLPIAVWYYSWRSRWRSDAANELMQRGHYDIVLCWETSGLSMLEIIAGKADAQFHDMVVAASSYPHTVVIRFFHEANGDWYDWSPASGRGLCAGPEELKQAWRHLVTVGREVAGSNVKFMWCMNFIDRKPYQAEDFFPGTDYVDVIGADVYATGNQTFEQVNLPIYNRLTVLHPSAEYWVPECGTDSTKNQASWYAGAYTSQLFPRMRAVCWFSVRQYVIDQHADAVIIHRRYLPPRQ